MCKNPEVKTVIRCKMSINSTMDLVGTSLKALMSKVVLLLYFTVWVNYLNFLDLLVFMILRCSLDEPERSVWRNGVHGKEYGEDIDKYFCTTNGCV